MTRFNSWKKKIATEKSRRAKAESAIKLHLAKNAELKTENDNLKILAKEKYNAGERILREEDLRRRFEELDATLAQLQMTVREKNQQIAQLEANEQSYSEMMDLYPAVVAQMNLHKEAFDDEHREHMRVKQEKENLERYCNIYKTERDRNLQRATTAELELVESRRSSTSALHRQSDYGNLYAASNPSSPRSHSATNPLKHIRPHASTFDHNPPDAKPSTITLKQSSSSTQQEHISRAATREAQQYNLRNQSPLGPGWDNIHPPMNQSALNLERRNQSGNYTAKGNIVSLGISAVLDASKKNQSQNVIARVSKSGIKIPAWFNSSAIESIESVPQEDDTWKCYACNHDNQPNRRSCLACGTLDPVQSHRLTE